MEAIDTGLFTYIAHPDLLNYTGDPAVYTRHMRTLCRAARDCGVPLELNLLGVEENRHYPNRLFWEAAAEEGCPVVLGCDAHRAEALLDTRPEKRALEMAAQLGLTVLENPVLKHI